MEFAKLWNQVVGSLLVLVPLFVTLQCYPGHLRRSWSPSFLVGAKVIGGVAPHDDDDSDPGLQVAASPLATESAQPSAPSFSRSDPSA